MAKRKKKKYALDDQGLAPEGLWISPEGDEHEVVEHLLALHERPDIFNLSAYDVHPPTVEILRNVAVNLISNGWIRFRYLAGVWAFEVDRLSRRYDKIEDVLVRYGRGHLDETVTISQFDPKQEFEGTVADVYDRRIIRFEQNPRRNRWRFS